jgi:predicted O-methyltransferase YrrM
MLVGGMLKQLLKRTVEVSSRGDSSAAADVLEHFPHEPLPAESAADVRGWAFPAHLDNPNCRWLQALKHVYGQRITFPASLSPEAGQLLHALVLNIRPRLVVETGTFLGVSTIWIAGALEVAGGEGIIHCVDDFRPIRKGRWRAEEMLSGREAKVREHLKMAGLADRVVLHPGESAAGVAEVTKALQEESAKGGRRLGVQLAFLDADHSPAGLRREFEALEPALDTGGYVILHDIYPKISRWKGPRELMDTVNSFADGRYECMDLYLAPANFGLGVLRRIG